MIEKVRESLAVHQSVTCKNNCQKAFNIKYTYHDPEITIVPTYCVLKYRKNQIKFCKLTKCTHDYEVVNTTIINFTTRAYNG